MIEKSQRILLPSISIPTHLSLAYNIKGPTVITVSDLHPIINYNGLYHLRPVYSYKSSVSI